MTSEGGEGGEDEQDEIVKEVIACDISPVAIRGSTGLRLSEFAQISEFFQF